MTSFGGAETFKRGSWRQLARRGGAPGKPEQGAQKLAKMARCFHLLPWSGSSVANPALAPANGPLAKAGLEPSEATWGQLLTPGSVVAKLPLLTCGGRGAPGREEEHRRDLGSLQPGRRCGGSWSQTSRLGSPSRLFPSRKGGNSRAEAAKDGLGREANTCSAPSASGSSRNSGKTPTSTGAPIPTSTFHQCGQESQQGPSDPSVAGQWPVSRFGGGGEWTPPRHGRHNSQIWDELEAPERLQERFITDPPELSWKLSCAFLIFPPVP